MLSFDQDDGQGPDSERTAETRAGLSYRWTCPLCGASRTGIVPGGEDEGYLDVRAKTALLSHVRAIEDREHGRRRSVPDDFDRDRLDRHVETNGSPR